MPEYDSFKKHNSGFSGEIHIGNYTSQRMRLLREKRRGDKPELTEEEELQKIRDEFGKRIAIASEQQKDVATVEHESQVQHKPQPQPKQPELEYEVETEAHSEATLVEQSLQAYQQKDYANAYELFSQIVAQQPDNYEALFHLGVSATETGNHTVAIETTKKLIDSGHFTAQAFYFQGISLEKLGRKPEASIAYQKAAAEIPEAHKSFMRLESEKLLGGFSSKIASPENQGRQSQSRKVAKSPQPTKSASTSPKSSKPTQSSRSVREDTTFNQSGRPSNYPRKDTTSEQPKKQSSRKAEKPFKPSSKSNSSFNFRGKDIAPTLLVKQGKSATKANQQLDVTKLVPVEKLAEAVSRSAKALPEEVAEELRALFTPATLATMVGVFAAYIAAHATGIGQAMDIGMLIAGGIFFGLDAFAIFKDIAGFAGAVNATTEEELDKAGEHLASAVAKIGVDAVMTLLTKKVADEVGKGLDNLKQVDEVHAHSEGANRSGGNLDNADNVNAGQINDVDRINQNQGREVQRIPDTDIVESNAQESPGFKGSGPAPGFIEISPGVRSTGAIESLNPNKPMDFVFDPVNKRFVVGSRKRQFGHDGIMDAAGRGIRNDNSVGGRIGRRNGILYTDEWSGHYGDRWNDTLRQQFESFKQEFGLDIPHLGDHDIDHLTK